MAQVFTVDDVRAMLANERESDEPDAILDILEKEEGKKITRRLLAKLPGGAERWRLDYIAGMTHLEDRNYYMHDGNKKGGFHFLLQYASQGDTVSREAILKHNPAYFSARIERNEKRAACAESAGMCQAMADALTAYAAAKEALDAAKTRLDGLTAYGEPFSPDQYDWERLCGAREERKH
jgi:hypothetical protein